MLLVLLSINLRLVCHNTSNKRYLAYGQVPISDMEPIEVVSYGRGNFGQSSYSCSLTNCLSVTNITYTY